MKKYLLFLLFPIVLWSCKKDINGPTELPKDNDTIQSTPVPPPEVETVQSCGSFRATIGNDIIQDAIITVQYEPFFNQTRIYVNGTGLNLSFTVTSFTPYSNTSNTQSAYISGRSPSYVLTEAPVQFTAAAQNGIWSILIDDDVTAKEMINGIPAATPSSIHFATQIFAVHSINYNSSSIQFESRPFMNDPNQSWRQYHMIQGQYSDKGILLFYPKDPEGDIIFNADYYGSRVKAEMMCSDIDFTNPHFDQYIQQHIPTVGTIGEFHFIGFGMIHDELPSLTPYVGTPANPITSHAPILGLYFCDMGYYYSTLSGSGKYFMFRLIDRNGNSSMPLKVIF